MKTWQTTVMLVAFALPITGVRAASGSPATQRVCNPPSTIDSLCRERATLRIRKPWTPKSGATDIIEVTNNGTVPLIALTGVSVIRGGVTDLYFKKQATCQAVDPDGGGTRIQTRTSRSSRVIFYQSYGLTLCTMTDGSTIAEGPGATLTASDPPTSKGSGARLPLTQFIALLDPSAGLQVAVRSGKLLITLSSRRSIPVGANKTLDVALIGPSAFSIADPYPTKFTPKEEALFASQAKRIRP